MRDGDTIVALSSGALPAGIAVIRLSGPLAGSLLVSLAGRLPEPRRLGLTSLRIAGDVIDNGLIGWFPGPHSFTGEDCAELQLHGSRAVVRRILRYLTEQAGVRLAEAGEFTRRAFEHGRMDLTAVEGLGDLLAAETEGQRRQAIARYGGKLAQQIASWRARLIDLRAELEARLDFADEGDVDALLPAAVATGIGELRSEISEVQATVARGRLVRDGFRVAIAGLPNAGKSSLLNALSRSDLAIVSDEAGTTRDVREVPIDLEGQLVILVDMAGLRDTSSSAEAEGVRRAKLEIAQADLVLWLVAPDGEAVDPPSPSPAPVWRVATKADLKPPRIPADLTVSVRTEDGLSELMQRLTQFVDGLAAGEPALISRERDRVALAAAAAGLDEAARNLDRLELAAEALRRAGHALAALVGEIDAEAVLDRLFAGFCIGK